MVHILFGRRAIAASARQQDIDLEAQRFLWERVNLEICQCGKNKQECKCEKFTPRTEFAWVQGARRPIELFEYVFPDKSPIVQERVDASGNKFLQKVGEKDNVEEVLSSLGIMNAEHYPKHGKFFDWVLNKIRSGLGLLPIPSTNESKQTRWIHQLGITLYPLGIKEDKKGKISFNGIGSYDQEQI